MLDGIDSDLNIDDYASINELIEELNDHEVDEKFDILFDIDGIES